MGLPPALAEKVERWADVGAAAAGLGWFLVIGGIGVVNPVEVRWLTEADAATHWLGWELFRNTSVGFPLGQLPNMLYPVGTTLGMTDSIPWVAIAFRPFSFLLPEDFQYLGLWLCASFALIAYFGARLAGIVTRAPVVRVLSGLLFAMSPVLIFRVAHEALCAQWLIVAMLWLNLRAYETQRDVGSALLGAVLMNVFAAGVHPYLAVMVLCLTAALLLRLRLVDGTLRWGGFVVLCAGFPALVYGVFWLFGYLTPGVDPGSWGFGFFGADLGTLMNPLGMSRYLDSKPTGGGAYEGIGYLGLGTMALIGVAVVAGALTLRAHWRPALRAIPVVLAAGVLFVFALSGDIKHHGILWYDFTWFYAPVAKYMAPFRSSGRFIWPLYYLLTGGAVVVIAHALRAWRHAAVVPLVVGLALQGADVRTEVGIDKIKPKGNIVLGAPEWTLARGAYQHLVLFPPIIYLQCGGWDAGIQQRVNRLTYLAYRLKMTINSGISSRYDTKATPAACQSTIDQVAAGRLDPASMYVTSPQFFPAFAAAGAVCGALDGEPVCVIPDAAGQFANALRAHPM